MFAKSLFRRENRRLPHRALTRIDLQQPYEWLSASSRDQWCDEAQASMPTRQGGSFSKNAGTCREMCGSKIVTSRLSAATDAVRLVKFAVNRRASSGIGEQGADFSVPRSTDLLLEREASAESH